MARNNKKTVKKSARFSKPKRAYKKSSLVQTVQAVVKAELHKNIENKHAYHSSSESALISFNSGITALVDLQRVVPLIGRGVDPNQRIGDRITLQKLNIHGYIKFDQIFTTGINYQSAVMVRLIVASFKTANNWDTIQNDFAAVKLAGLLKKGGSTVGYTGLISDCKAPINRDIFTVHSDKKYYIHQDRMTSAIGSSTNNTVKFFNIPLKVKNKLLKYSDDTSGATSPTNFSPVLMIGYSYLDGTIPDLVAAECGLFYQVDMEFEDA